MRHDDPAFEGIVRRGRGALAWEVLRRDPAYRAAYIGLAARRAAGVGADTVFVMSWGLHFR